MVIQKRASRSNTKSQSSLRNKKETASNSMKQQLYNYYLYLKLSWTLFKLKWQQSFLTKSPLDEFTKRVANPSKTSSSRLTPAVVNKSQKGSSRKVGNLTSLQKKGRSSSTKPRSKASTSPKQKP